MCGIFGAIVKPNSKISSYKLVDLVNNFFKYSELRGKEASGIVLKNNYNESISVLKKSCTGSKFIKSNDYNVLLKKNINKNTIKSGMTIMGHTRIATNGSLLNDNQPIIKNGAFGVHNGIICNIEELWLKHSDLNRQHVIDSELLFSLIKKQVDNIKGLNIRSSVENIFDQIEGTASFGVMFDNYSSIIIGTNCGSLYYYFDSEIFLFSSESYILINIIKHFNKQEITLNQINHLEPTSFVILSEKHLSINLIKINDSISDASLSENPNIYEFTDLTTERQKNVFSNNHEESYIKSLLRYDKNSIENLRRCTRCILPETHPFIQFDENGVCNFCHDYDKRSKRIIKGRDALDKHFELIRSKHGQNCILMLSGGRDSCYALHVVKKELGLNPIAFSYDWGMLTDLGRRNQARMCSKLGVEHIIVSADISQKRNYVKMNVDAFLHKPNLGTIGLFMAGDKAYHHFARELSNRLDLPLINGGSPLEWTYFKQGFSGIKPSFLKRTILDRLEIIRFFAIQALGNRKYLNASIFDNLLAFKYYYGKALNVTNLFHYLPWSEEVVNKTLIEEYNWELANDTTTTWRIGDGTAAFYNYIYLSVTGFTENDCFRSNQVLEGIITREEALELAEAANQPRYESLKWYCDTIGLDMEYAINTINRIPKLY
jgi:glucosamine--fructose-6-phosphate aminotransferase (isomerizing)